MQQHSMAASSEEWEGLEEEEEEEEGGTRAGRESLFLVTFVHMFSLVFSPFFALLIYACSLFSHVVLTCFHS